MPATLSAQHQILDAAQIRQKITRIAYEIYERNFEETDLVLVGIAENGFFFAELLAKELQHISPIQITIER